MSFANPNTSKWFFAISSFNGSTAEDNSKNVTNVKLYPTSQGNIPNVVFINCRDNIQVKADDSTLYDVSDFHSDYLFASSIESCKFVKAHLMSSSYLKDVTLAEIIETSVENPIPVGSENVKILSPEITILNQQPVSNVTIEAGFQSGGSLELPERTYNVKPVAPTTALVESFESTEFTKAIETIELTYQS